MFEDVEVNSERWFDLTPLLNEEFRIIKETDNEYKISNYGRLINKKNKILRSNKARGYLQYQLICNGKRRCKGVHRWVAEAFLPNPNNLTEINHKDENKLNNRIDNLEWCSHKYNNNYGTKVKRTIEKTSKKIIQYSKDGKTIKIWNSMNEACKTLGIDRRSVFKCCHRRKRARTTGGYIWRYENDKEI